MTERRRESPPATPRPDRRLHSAAVLLALVLAAPAMAQYRDAGTEIDILPDRQEQLERSMEEAPWRFGKLRVSPWIGLRDVNYVRELDPQGRQRPGDLTATAGAGLRAYLKLGEHAIAAAHAAPEYAWWQRENDRSAVIGHYGVGMFGWFNRLHGEVTARSVEEVRFLSSDLLVREPTRDEELAASAQLRILGSIAVYGAGTMNRTRVAATSGLTPVDPARLLDRDGSLVRAGLRYLLPGKHGYIGAGAFSERTEFQAADAIRSNKGSSWYAETGVVGNHLDLSVQYDQRDLEADDSSFPGFRAGSGRVNLAIHPGRSLRYQLYGLRQLRYSALSLGTYTEEERLGAALGLKLGTAGLQLFYEDGSDRYFGTVAREENVTARGASLDIPLRQLKLRVGGRQTDFEPDVGPKRQVRELLGSVSLSFGAPGDW